MKSCNSSKNFETQNFAYDFFLIKELTFARR